MNTSMGAATTKHKVHNDERCQVCLLNSYQRLMDKFAFNATHRDSFMVYYRDVIGNSALKSSPAKQRELNKMFCKLAGKTDLYLEEKALSNKVAFELYHKWKPSILSAETPFNLALRLSIAANIMDYGASSKFDLDKTIRRAVEEPLAIDHSALLKERIKEAKSVLFLGDNAGEIVFDKLFIETFMHNHVFYAVRSAPVLNDATMDDAKSVGMDLVADVISNGYDAPGTVLSHCSKEFLNIYNSADLIIAKGQGNFETLLNQDDPRLFFLLTVKCDAIAELLHVKKYSIVTYNQTKSN